MSGVLMQYFVLRAPTSPNPPKYNLKRYWSEKNSTKNIFSVIFVCDKKAIPDVSHTFMFFGPDFFSKKNSDFLISEGFFFKGGAI